MPYYVGDVTPDYTAALNSLQPLQNDALKQLFNDDAQLETMVKNLQQVKNLEQEREMLLASNKSIAEFNLSFEPQLTKTRQQLDKKYKEALQLKSELESNKSKIDGFTRQQSLDTVYALLQTASAQAEEETEKIAEEFLQNDLPVEAFLESFLVKRKLAHIRRIKSEKMGEILNGTNDLRNRQPARPAPMPPNIPLPPLPVAYPPMYPLQPQMAMPTSMYR